MASSCNAHVGPPALGQRPCPSNQLKGSKLSRRAWLPRTAVPSLQGRGETAQAPGEEVAPGDKEVGSLEKEHAGEMEGNQGEALEHLLTAGLQFMAPVCLLQGTCVLERAGQPCFQEGFFGGTNGQEISPMTHGVCSSSEPVYSIYCVYTVYSLYGLFIILYCTHICYTYIYATHIYMCILYIHIYSILYNV